MNINNMVEWETYTSDGFSVPSSGLKTVWYLWSHWPLSQPPQRSPPLSQHALWLSFYCWHPSGPIAAESPNVNAETNRERSTLGEFHSNRKKCNNHCYCVLCTDTEHGVHLCTQYIILYIFKFICQNWKMAL